MRLGVKARDTGATRARYGLDGRGGCSGKCESVLAVRVQVVGTHAAPELEEQRHGRAGDARCGRRRGHTAAPRRRAGPRLRAALTHLAYHIKLRTFCYALQL